LTVRDEGSGIDDDRMEISIGTLSPEAEYDPDRGWLEIQVPSEIEKGKHVLSVVLYDKVGNKSEPFLREITLLP